MKLFMDRKYSIIDIGLIKWSCILFGSLVGAYLSDFTLRHVWMFVIIASLLAIKPVVSYFTVHNSNKYLTSSVLKNEELTMLQNEDVLLLLDKLWAGIDKIKNILSEDGYIVSRTTQSRSFYAFRIERAWGMIWISFDHYCWQNYKTPYVLKLRNDMIKESGRVSDLENGLTSNGFLYDKNLGYIYPIIISNSNIAVSTLVILKRKIKQLDEMFERLLI